MKSRSVFTLCGLCAAIALALIGCSNDSSAGPPGPAAGSPTPGGGTITAKSMPAHGPHMMHKETPPATTGQ